MYTATGAYYENHAGQFFNDTIAVDMSPLYARFLPHIPAGGHILDAGCGSCRDTRAFLALGYRVTAFDASPSLAALAEQHVGHPVQVLRLQDLAWHQTFDGIWACASLVHVPAAELPEALRRLALALRSQGALYASFKYGRGERDHQGRRFSDLDEPGLQALLDQVRDLRELETWSTGDLRPGRTSERWLNTLLVTTGETCPSN